MIVPLEALKSIVIVTTTNAVMPELSQRKAKGKDGLSFETICKF